MRLQQVEKLSALKLTVLFVGGFLFARSLFRIPFFGVSHALILGILAGLVILPFLDLRFALRYLGAFLILPGAAGLLNIARHYLQPLLSTSRYSAVELRNELVTCTIFLLYLLTGLLMMRMGKEKTEERPDLDQV